jgi:hypothetical protein
MDTLFILMGKLMPSELLQNQIQKVSWKTTFFRVNEEICRQHVDTHFLDMVA